jgi:hypothetical protein
LTLRPVGDKVFFGKRCTLEIKAQIIMDGETFYNHQSVFRFTEGPIINFGDQHFQIPGTSVLMSLDWRKIIYTPIRPNITKRMIDFLFLHQENPQSTVKISAECVYLFDVSTENRIIIGRTIFKGRYENAMVHYMECAISKLTPKMGQWLRDRVTYLCTGKGELITG